MIQRYPAEAVRQVEEAPVATGAGEMPYLISSDVYVQMVEQGLIPANRRVFL